jgi:hypothetical protein
MPNTYEVKLEDINKNSPYYDAFALYCLAERTDKIVLGTSHINADREECLQNLIYEELGGYAKGTFSSKMAATEEDLTFCDYPYFSKKDRESPIEFFNTPRHFSWAFYPQIRDFLLSTNFFNIFYDTYYGESEEDLLIGRDEVFSFWNDLLKSDTSIYENGKEGLTWQILKHWIFGEEKSMEPSIYVR